MENLLLHFQTMEELKEFRNYLDIVDVEHYSIQNRSKGFAKDVYLAIGKMPFNIALTKEEFSSLKQIIDHYLIQNTINQNLFLVFSELHLPLSPN
jgi:hypothetical protein